MSVAALTVVLFGGVMAAIFVLLVVAVRKLFEGTFSFPRFAERTRPYRSGPGIGRGGGRRPWPAGVREPRRPRPGFGAGSVALPEPREEREAG
jgi:hypothetical protein